MGALTSIPFPQPFQTTNQDLAAKLQAKVAAPVQGVASFPTVVMMTAEETKRI